MTTDTPFPPGTIIQCVTDDDWHRMMGYTGRLYLVSRTMATTPGCCWVHSWPRGARGWELRSLMPIPDAADYYRVYATSDAPPPGYAGEALPIV